VFSNASSYESDWQKLNEAASEKFSLIPDNLGQQLQLDRNRLLGDLEKTIANCKGLFIEGISGSGKTNLAKLFAEKIRKESSVLWLDSTDFDSASIEIDLKLDNLLPKLIEETSDAKAYLFIDGIERLHHERQLQKIAIILKKALVDSSPWKVVLTCISEQLDKVRQLLIKFNLPSSAFQSFEIPELDFKDLDKIALTYPELEKILFSRSMKNTRNNLKLLDKLIQNSKSISELSSTQNLGETHLIDFVWSEEVENAGNGLQASSFLQHLSAQQADTLSIGVNINLFSPNELSPADTLRSLGFLQLRQEKLYFNHDLYSDWARYKLIKSYGNKLPIFLKEKQLTSPLWAKAVRLYGMSLLEQEPSGTVWQNIYYLFNDGSSQHIIVQDLLLEAFFFTPNSYSLLTIHKEFLFANDALQLKRITKLFLLRATQSDPSIIELAKEIGITEKQASSYERLPIVIYWPGMIKFLWDEAEIVLQHDLINVVKIASLWLEKTPPEFPMKQEVGNLSLKAAEKIFSSRKEGTYVDEKVQEPVYKALLLGYSQNPEQVKALCLQICKRTITESTTQNAEDQNTDKSFKTVTSRLFSLRKLEPWPLGPFDRVDDAFRKLCLEGRAIFPILQYDPQLASEILLAVLIEEPTDNWHGSDGLNDHYEIIEEHGWYPPFYLRGPFLNFLRISSVEALSFICKLTDFATDRWLENPKIFSSNNNIPAIVKGKSVKYFGDFYVFGWHKDIGNAPHSLVSALMALEQFFYEEIENNKNIDEHVSYLVKNTKSLAIISVLFTVGKLYPPLYSYQLKPFLSEYLFYEWDSNIRYHDFTTWGDFGQAWQEHVKKWKERPHRKFSIRDIVFHLILNDDHFQNEFITIREKWQSQLLEMQTRNERDVFLYQLIHQSNPSNYEKKVTQEGTYFEYKEPSEVSRHLEPGRKASVENMQDSQMAYKCQMMIDQKLPFELAGAEYLWSKTQANYSKLVTTLIGISFMDARCMEI
jgi:energy-coupling factor transporter ATP-binding protein EcfA2